MYLYIRIKYCWLYCRYPANGRLELRHSKRPHAASRPALRANACRDHALVAGVVMFDLPAYPERYAARLATSGSNPSPYVMLAHTLIGIREMLPPGLVRAERTPADPPEVVEIWFAG